MTSPGSPGPPSVARERWVCRLRATLTGHTGGVGAVAWGQVGGRPVLASAGLDGTVRLWDPEPGQELRTLTGYPSGIWAVAWGQLGGRPVLAGGGGDGPVGALAWGQLGGRPVLASAGRPVRLWDPEPGQELRTLTGYPSGIWAVAWGQLGGRPVLAGGGGDGPVRCSTVGPGAEPAAAHADRPHRRCPCGGLGAAGRPTSAGQRRRRRHGAAVGPGAGPGAAHADRPHRRCQCGGLGAAGRPTSAGQRRP